MIRIKTRWWLVADLVVGNTNEEAQADDGHECLGQIKSKIYVFLTTKSTMLFGWVR